MLIKIMPVIPILKSKRLFFNLVLISFYIYSPKLSLASKLLTTVLLDCNTKLSIVFNSSVVKYRQQPTGKFFNVTCIILVRFKLTTL